MKRSLAKKFVSRLSAMHRDEQGAALIEYILIIAAVALPLLGVVIWFKDDIYDWVGDVYNENTGRDISDMDAD